MAAWSAMVGAIEAWEQGTGISLTCNRLFYFAVPPTVFLEVASSIKNTACSATGWNRLVVEKPFGHDYESCEGVSHIQTKRGGGGGGMADVLVPSDGEGAGVL